TFDDCTHLGGIDAVVHALVIPVVDAPRAADAGGGGLHGQPTECRVQLLPTSLNRSLEAAHCDQDTGVMRGRRCGLDHLAEAALGVGAGEAGDFSTTLVQQG